MSQSSEVQDKKPNHTLKNTLPSFYATLWRWHFYTGFFVAPFLMILALTGLGMVLTANIQGRDLEHTVITQATNPVPLDMQLSSAQSLDSTATIVSYTSPKTADSPALFRLKSDSADHIALINPYDGQVVKVFDRHSNLYHTFDNIHSDLLLGTAGDLLLEMTASLTILLVFSGVYLWYLRQRSLTAMLAPKIKGKTWARSLHGSLGAGISVILLLFCITGLAWAGIWGGKLTQSWSQFPAGKWGVEPTPISAPTHGDVFNEGSKETPWALEQTPMPISHAQHHGDESSMPAIIQAYSLSDINQKAHDMGFTGRYHINFPKGETGVWTISQDSMSYDMANPTADRTVHIDRYNGKVLADIRFEDYNWFGKFMAVGVALHMGSLGMVSVFANVLFCLLVVAMCVTGYIMWHKRRPSKAVLNPPPRKSLPPTAVVIALLLLSALFPVGLMVIVVMVLLDWLVIGRIQKLSAWFK